MLFLQHNLIHRIMVIKSNKFKSSFLSILPISNYLNGINFSMFLKVIFLEKEMSTHSSVLAWRIRGGALGEEGGHGGLTSMGSHRVRHN